MRRTLIFIYGSYVHFCASIVAMGVFFLIIRIYLLQTISFCVHIINIIMFTFFLVCHIIFFFAFLFFLRLRLIPKYKSQ